MELTYELYCLADATFYDDPNLAPRKSNPDFPFAQEPVPAVGPVRLDLHAGIGLEPNGRVQDHVQRAEGPDPPGQR